MGAIIYKVIKISNNYQINTYEEFLDKLGTKNIIIKLIINIFLIISFYIMISGFSAYFEQELNIPKTLGSLLIILLCYILFTKNINGIMKISTILIPILIIFIIIFGIKNINLNNNTCITKTNIDISIKWLLSSILYTSYNSITLIPILIPIRKLIKNKKQNRTLFIIIIIITITLALIIYFLIEQIEININNIELPTVYIASKNGYIYKYIYGIIILVAIFTTAISAGYGFLQNYENKSKKYKILNKMLCISAIFISNIGFSNLVNLLYPIFGILGLIQIYKIFSISLEKNT